jgi:hypothetical protein
VFQLVTAALALFWAWECLVALLPFIIPSWLQPVLVLGGAVGVRYLPGTVLLVGAISGAVALLHQLLTVMGAVSSAPRVRRIPRI